MLKASEAHRATVAVIESSAAKQDIDFEEYFVKKIQPEIEKVIQAGEFDLNFVISTWEMSYGEAQQLGNYLENRLGYRTALQTFMSCPVYQLNICW